MMRSHYIHTTKPVQPISAADAIVAIWKEHVVLEVSNANDIPGQKGKVCSQLLSWGLSCYLESLVTVANFCHCGSR